MQEDQLPAITVDNDDDSLPIPQMIEQQIETRRPRVYFADFNKVQFIEDHNEGSQQYQTANLNSYRRHRRRLSKKTSNTNGNTQISPSIQQTQVIQSCSRPLSRQPNHQIAQELSIKKQLFASPRAHSSRITYLPDILNHSLPVELPSNENSNGKYTLQREKPLTRLPKSILEIPSTQSTDIVTEETRNNNPRFSPMPDLHNQSDELEYKENNSGSLVHGNSSISQTSINRQRQSLRTISLRQQFISPIKLKPANTNHQSQQQQQQLNNPLPSTRRSAVLKPSTLRMPDDNNDPHPNNGSVINTTENNRPTTSTRFPKQLKRADVIHFNSKNPPEGNTTNDSTRSHAHETTPERFRNLLTIVRPPYASGSNGTPSTMLSFSSNDYTPQSINNQQTLTNLRSTRSTSARGSFVYHPTSNTIIV
jgi:hypothetical protein